MRAFQRSPSGWYKGDLTFRSDTDALRLQVRLLRDEIEALERERRDLEREASMLESEAEARARAVSGGSWRLPVIIGVLILGVVLLMTVVVPAMGSDGETLYGRVVSTSGSPPVPEGARCTAFVSPHTDSDSDFDVQIELLCDGQVVYGAGSSGYVECGGDHSRPAHCLDTDFTAEGGDPQLELVRAQRRIRVEEPTWRIDIELLLPGAGRSR